MSISKMLEVKLVDIKKTLKNFELSPEIEAATYERITIIADNCETSGFYHDLFLKDDCEFRTQLYYVICLIIDLETKRATFSSIHFKKAESLLREYLRTEEKVYSNNSQIDANEDAINHELYTGFTATPMLFEGEEDCEVWYPSLASDYAQCKLMAIENEKARTNISRRLDTFGLITPENFYEKLTKGLLKGPIKKFEYEV